jgi:hypothetical protein
MAVSCLSAPRAWTAGSLRYGSLLVAPGGLETSVYGRHGRLAWRL